ACNSPDGYLRGSPLFDEGNCAGDRKKGRMTASSQRFQIRFDPGALAFKKGRKRKSFPEFRQRFIRRESGAIGCKLEQDRIRFSKIEAAKVITIHFAAVWDAQFVQAPGPCVIGLLVF